MNGNGGDVVVEVVVGMVGMGTTECIYQDLSSYWLELE